MTWASPGSLVLAVLYRSIGDGKKATQGCPCGFRGSTDHQCRCGPIQVEKYLSKISGPLLDRISIHITVRPVAVEALRGESTGETSEALREQATRAREIQRRRFCDIGIGEDGHAGACNALIPESKFREVCRMAPEAEELLFSAQKRLHISARGRAHVIRVARTIADLGAANRISAGHIAEAIQYRIREKPSR